MSDQEQLKLVRLCIERSFGGRRPRGSIIRDFTLDGVRIPDFMVSTRGKIILLAPEKP